MRTVSLILIAIFFASPLAMAEQFYKWQDDKGVWHFSEKPPKDQPADKLKVRNQTAVPSDETDANADTANAAAAAPNVPAGETIESANCRAAQNNLTVLNSSPVVSKDTDGDGVAENLTLDQHQEEIVTAERQIAAFCKPAKTEVAPTP